MANKWTDDLATGISIIDRQHKDLFVKTNNLMDAMSRGKGRDEVENTIKFLGDYVILHFSAEEKLMLDNKYPDYAVHKAQHQALITDFKKIRDNFTTKGSSTVLTIEIQTRIDDWLINHIGKVDKMLGKYIKEHK